MSEDISLTVMNGRLTRDAELKYTNSGVALCSFSIAVNERRKNSQGVYSDQASFFDIAIWGNRGESLNQYLVRGQQVSIEGRLRQDRWEQDGHKRSKVVLNASTVQLLGGKKDNVQESTADNSNDWSKFKDDIPY